MRPLALLSGPPSTWLPAASGVAPQVDHVIASLLGAALLVVVALTAFTLYVLVRYRRGSKADRRPVAIATWKIETTWLVGTVAVFLVFFFQGARVYVQMERIPPGLPEINVTGRQWMWDVRYADGRREFNVIHVQRDQPVRIVLSSEDVIHSFFVPAFRVKQDAVPGKVVSTWFTPTKTGTFTLFCAQYCGTAHAEMIGQVVVLDPADYRAWSHRWSAYAPATTPGARGAALYRHLGCGLCHDGNAVTTAPSLRGLYGSTVTLADGRQLPADEQYLHDALVAGPRFRVAGYPPSMPTFDGILSAADLADLTAYLQTLRPPVPGESARP